MTALKKSIVSLWLSGGSAFVSITGLVLTLSGGEEGGGEFALILSLYRGVGGL